MMWILKALATIGTVCIGVAGLFFICYAPYRCNSEIKGLEELTRKAFAEAESPNVVFLVRRNLRRASDLNERCPTNLHLYMIKGANYRVLKRYDDAAREYRQALYYGHRAEVHYNLGLAELRAGRRESAIENFVNALEFSSYWMNIPDPEVAAEVSARLQRAKSPRSIPGK